MYHLVDIAIAIWWLSITTQFSNGVVNFMGICNLGYTKPNHMENWLIFKNYYLTTISWWDTPGNPTPCGCRFSVTVIAIAVVIVIPHYVMYYVWALFWRGVTVLSTAVTIAFTIVVISILHPFISSIIRKFLPINETTIIFKYKHYNHNCVSAN